MLALEVVVRTDFLNKLVVDAEEGDENADHFEGLGAEPGSVGLGVLREAGLGRIVQAGFGFLGPVGFLVLHAAVEGLRLFGVDGGLVGLLDQDVLLGVHLLLLLLLEDLELHHFGRRYDADRHIAQAGRVVPEVNRERSVDVVDDLSRHQQAELHGFDVKVEVSPAEDLLSLHGCLKGGLALGAIACLVQEQRLVTGGVVWVKEVISGWLGFHGRLVDGGGENACLVWRFNHAPCRARRASSYTIWQSLHHRPNGSQV